MTVQPSYTVVEARRTLEPPKKNDFPVTLKSWVGRAFLEYNKVKGEPAFAAITDSDIKQKLSSTITQAQADGTMNERDWSSHLLPHQLILEERQKAAMYMAQNAILANLHSDLGAYGAAAYASNGKKRKSPDQEMTDENGRAVTPPWKKSNTKSIADRITGQSKKQEKKMKTNGKIGRFDNSEAALERRRQRFGNISPDSSPPHSRDDSPAVTATSGPIVGTCEVLEKRYFRLTAPPNPNTVRPLALLEKALEHVIAKWKTGRDYTYVCDQLKSIRQDLTVQHLKNKFTIRVYEVHARIALEKKDLGEYNQCQTQLRALYKMKLGENGASGGNQDEFTAYRILYLIYTRNRTDMNNMLADLTTADKKGPFVRLALNVRQALAAGNYHRFFKLYNEAQDWNMAPFLMDMFIERERVGAMAAICRAYKPDVGAKFLTQDLGFAVDEAESVFESDQLRSCLSFIERHGGGHLVLEKDGDTRVLTGKAGLLFESAKQSAFGKVDIKGQI
ncbi:Putative SAC3/GANP/THP3 domain-containing protein [Septoria linicola]|uniref:SAC3/GANP/THP3 domain-containing protein n=1 Tax=Septoria linicola TaxID=215465 RepID=A0A9Q9AYS5_9PEZI|nr:putative SAC3/GANP/THP3 domain-containing protein [Septoria linicola]USW54523.1 Putative SAC3/GANP/THP3 domain-containing protein [Septoria linicola]